MKQPYPCAHCGATVLRQPSGVVGRVFCSRACSAAALVGQPSKRRPLVGPEHPRWKGGRRVTSTGYVMLWKPDHPNADEHGYIFEHRLVMSEHLGRALLPSEHVHHKNENRSDNRLENLELLSSAEHMSRHQQEYRAQYGWSRQAECCVSCGTTERRHYGKGLCIRCYMREHMARQRAAGYIVPSRRK